MTTRRLRRILAAAACFGVLAVNSSSHAGGNSTYRFGGNSELLIWRAPDFGTEMFLIVSMDGVQLAALPKGNGYRAIIVPGRHVLTVTNSPSPYGKTRLFSKEITFRAGECSAFSTAWESDRLIFEKADEGTVRNRMMWAMAH